MEVTASASLPKTNVMNGMLENSTKIVAQLKEKEMALELSSPNSAQSPSPSLPLLLSEPILACRSWTNLLLPTRMDPVPQLPRHCCRHCPNGMAEDMKMTTRIVRQLMLRYVWFIDR